tara:strand:- start:1895 stop:2587 length:693 start_codon:yes stop_codon:yes gene_type:complete
MKPIVINIGTPCGLNPHNLHLIRDSIFKQPLVNDEMFDIRWHVSIDTLVCSKSDIESSLFDDMYSFTETECGCWGNQGKNALMENVNEGWVLLVDDDNVLHYDLYTVLYPILNGQNPSLTDIVKFIVFGHDTGEQFKVSLSRESRYSHPQIIHDDTGTYIRPSTCDSGQVVFHHSVWKPYPTKPTKDNDLYDADYWFYQNAFKEDQEKYGCEKRFYFSDHVATFYNRLRW